MAAIQLTPETAPANATTHVRQKKTMHAAHRKWVLTKTAIKLITPNSYKKINNKTINMHTY